MNNNLKKSFIWNTLGSGLSSILSLVLMIIVTRINGTDIAGIFTVNYATSLILYSMSLYSGRTFQITENNKNITDKDFIIQRIICILIVIFIMIIFGIIRKYDLIKFIILILLCVTKVIEALSDVFHGILQKNKRLDIVGKSLLSRATMTILIFAIVDYYTKNIVLSIISMIIINLCTLFFVDMNYYKNYREKKLYNKK